MLPRHRAFFLCAALLRAVEHLAYNPGIAIEVLSLQFAPVQVRRNSF
jgi:hypothetical protein